MNFIKKVNRNKQSETNKLYFVIGVNPTYLIYTLNLINKVK